MSTNNSNLFNPDNKEHMYQNIFDILQSANDQDYSDDSSMWCDDCQVSYEDEEHEDDHCDCDCHDYMGYMEHCSKKITNFIFTYVNDIYNSTLNSNDNEQ